MEKKPIIVILTSRDEIDGVSNKLAESIKAIGTHNPVIVSDEKYGSATKLSALDKLMERGQEYQYLLEKKDRNAIRERLKIKGLSKRVNRINNITKRFNPEYIICVTPYAHHCAVEAKKKAKFETQIIYMMMDFTAGKRRLDNTTSVYIVENSDVKSTLVRNGIKAKSVMVMGLPYEIEKPNSQEILARKQDLGLPRMKTVFVNIQNHNDLEKIFDLLLDQGAIMNLVINCKDEKVIETLGARSAKVQNMTVLYTSNEDMMNEYISCCDMIITDYNPAIIYKGFKLEIPSIVFNYQEASQKDIDFLCANNLCLKAKEDIEIVGLLYSLLQNDGGKDLIDNGRKWVEYNSLNNIAEFLVNYIAI